MSDPIAALLQSTDARDWARAWMEIVATNPTIPTDEGAMLGWFANAINVGIDSARRRYEAIRNDTATPNPAIERIRQREVEHQLLHERDGRLESCLPAGCAPDEGDIPALLREIDRLTAALRERGESRLVTLPLNAQGHVDCPACGGPALDQESTRTEWAEAEIRALAAEEGIDLTDCVVSGISAPDGIGREQMISRLRLLAATPTGISVRSEQSKRARPNAGRPRNCPNFKSCKGRLKSATDKGAGVCGKCRKAAKR